MRTGGRQGVVGEAAGVWGSGNHQPEAVGYTKILIPSAAETFPRHQQGCQPISQRVAGRYLPIVITNKIYEIASHLITFFSTRLLLTTTKMEPPIVTTTIIPDTESLTSPVVPKKNQSLEEILIVLSPISSILYTPFQPESSRLAKLLLPLTFPPKLYPFNYFSLFITPDLFKIISMNTNKYASLQRMKIVEERA